MATHARLRRHLARGATVVALPLVLVLGGAQAGYAEDVSTPTPVAISDGPVPLVRTADGRWAFEVRLHGGSRGYVASWERTSGTWSGPDAAKADITAADACDADVDAAFFNQFPSLHALETAPGVSLQDDRLVYDQTVVAAFETQYEACTAASQWHWDRTSSRTDGDDLVVTVPLSVVGPGEHELFVLGVGLADTTTTRHWSDGWFTYPVKSPQFGDVARFTVYVPEPTTQATGALLRAPAAVAGSWFAQSGWSNLAPVPFSPAETPRTGPGGAATPAPTAVASPAPTSGATATPAPTPTAVDASTTHVRAAAVASWFDPSPPPGAGAAVATGAALALLVGLGALVGSTRRRTMSALADPIEPTGGQDD